MQGPAVSRIMRLVCLHTVVHLGNLTAFLRHAGSPAASFLPQHGLTHTILTLLTLLEGEPGTGPCMCIPQLFESC